MPVKCAWFGKMILCISYYSDRGKTASGHEAARGAVAVRNRTGVCKFQDWPLEPLRPKDGDRWYEFGIPQYGRGKPRDRGGSVTRYDRLDIWLENSRAWRKWVKDANAREVRITEYKNAHHPEGERGCDPAKLIRREMIVYCLDVDVYECRFVPEKKGKRAEKRDHRLRRGARPRRKGVHR